MYIGAPIAKQKVVKAKSRGIPTDSIIGNKITPIAITEPTPYALIKINEVTNKTKIADNKGFFLPILFVSSEIEEAMPLSTSTRPNQEPKMI